MKLICFVLLFGAVAACTVAQAEVTFEIMGPGGATDISADGSVVVGNTEGTYETFRWTALDGFELLGGSTAQMGIGAGTPDVSADGMRASATIADVATDTTYVTQGLWTQGLPWTETMPPTPPDGGLMDRAYGSAFGLSGDGSTLVGLYWRPGHSDGSAHACYWTEETGVISLGSSGGSSRANDADYDGSVVVGWVATPTGTWQPTVWVDGDMTILNASPILCEASVANDAGTILVGQTYSDSLSHRVATVWRWNGSGWDEDVLGALPGTFANYGTVYPHDISADGSMIVGYNAFDWSQSTGFIWTEETGMVDVEDYLSDNGITVPMSFNIRVLTGMSDDGTVMVGSGHDTYPPYSNRWFIIRSATTGIADEPGPSEEAELISRVHVYPNPIRGAATFSLSLPEGRSHVDFEIYDISGRLVRRFVDSSVDEGTHEVHWDGRDTAGTEVASGVYLCRVAADGQAETVKITVLR